MTRPLVALAIAMLSSTTMVRSEQLGPFVGGSPDRTTIISPNCEPKSDLLECQFAVTSIVGAGPHGKCYVYITSYRLSFKRGKDGGWAGYKEYSRCSLRSDFSIETDSGSSTIARLRIKQTYRDNSPACARVGYIEDGKITKSSESIFEYNAKEPFSFTLGCERFAVSHFENTIPFVTGNPSSR